MYGRLTFRNGTAVWLLRLITCKFNSFQNRYTLRRLPVEVKKNQIDRKGPDGLETSPFHLVKKGNEKVSSNL
jgi:hypothetical protein